MKSKSIFFITLFAMVFNLSGLAQIQKANKLFETFNYSEAIPLYLKVIEKNDSDRDEATFKLAECYRFTNDVEEACTWYKKTIELGGAEPITYYYLGQALKSMGKYDEAAEAFTNFSTLEPFSLLDGEKQAQNCIEIKGWLNLPELFEVKNVVTLNSKYSEFCPVLFNRGIVFTSDKQKDPLNKNRFGWTNTDYLDLYYAEPGYSGKYWSWVDQEPKLMSHEFNQSFHDGPATFSSDFNQVYITRTVEEKVENSLKTYMLKIFFAQLEKDKKLELKPFFLNSNNYSVAHPTLSDDNKMIIFSSDMPGGYGGFDLYYCVWEDYLWSEPINMGDKINTHENEVFPYLANDSILFFSSNGLIGFGGLDIFQTTRVEEKWTEPENLKKPLNSSYDDFGILFSEDLEQGLLSSNRPEGRGADDIYAFRKLNFASVPSVESKQIISTSKSSLLVSGYVKETSTGNPLNKATVFVYAPVSGDVFILKTNEKGYYEIMLEHGSTYVNKVMKNGFFHDCLKFQTPGDNKIKSFKISDDLLISKMDTGQIFTIRNIYYDLDKWEVNENGQRVLDSLVQIMKQYPIVAELSSHTDSRASKSYNEELSQKRADAAVQYINLQGIPKTRISAKGYGESKLLNHCADGVPCSEKQHGENRRTEFKIVAIDGLLFGSNTFSPDFFEAGDVTNVSTLGYGFFQDCASPKMPIAKEVLEPVNVLKVNEEKKVEKKVTVVAPKKEDPGPAVVPAVVEKNEKIEKPAPEKNVQNNVVAKPEIKDGKYRIQLIALSKPKVPELYFADIKDLIAEYGITTEKTGSMYKYQLGNFSSKQEANKVISVLKGRNYKCFIVEVDN